MAALEGTRRPTEAAAFPENRQSFQMGKLFRGPRYQVARLLAEGISEEEIVQKLGLSEDTVREHVKKITRALKRVTAK